MDRYQLGTLLVSLPGLVLSTRHRAWLCEMRHFDRTLVQETRRPLPQAMDTLTPADIGDPPEQDKQGLIRRLSDIAIMANGDSGLGLCLRRSLIRYHYLRRVGLPVTINFGAKMIDGNPTGQSRGCLAYSPPGGVL